MSDFTRILKRQLIKVLIALALFLIVAWFVKGGINKMASDGKTMSQSLNQQQPARSGNRSQ